MKVKFPPQQLRDTIRSFLRILSSLNPNPQNYLTDAEINLLAEFLLLPPKYEFYLFSKVPKKKVRENLLSIGWKLSAESMNQKLYSLIDKQYLYRDEDNVIYLSKYLKHQTKHLLDKLNSQQDFNILITFLPPPSQDETRSKVT